MSEQSQHSIDFEDKKKQNLFQTLISQIRYQNRPYTKEDLKVDLVIRMPIPNCSYDLKQKEPEFSKLFKNTPPVYEEIYALVGEFIHYLVQTNESMQGVSNEVVRTMTSLIHIYPEVVKKVRLDLQLEDPLQDGSGNKMDIECKYAMFHKTDTFMLKYNMMMLILEKLCGFKVRSFILDDEPTDLGNGQKLDNTALYLLISLSTQNLLKSADKYKLKKQICMSILDFLVNDPSDSKNRPIKINSVFKNKQFEGFSDAIKRLNADLGLSNKWFADEIIEQAKLSSYEIRKYEKYFEQLQYEVSKVFPPTELKDKLEKIKMAKGRFARKNLAQTINQFNLRQTRITPLNDPDSKRYSLKKDYGNIPYLNPENAAELKRLGLDELNKYQRSYIYNYNRQKINKGCQQKFLYMKKKKYIFDKIMELNEKYGYSNSIYKDNFVEFALPRKQKPFFEKLEHMLKYEYYNMSPYGDLTMFTNMQRIKLAYLKIQQFIKIQQLDRMGMDIFAINNQYERFGSTQYEYDNDNQNCEEQGRTIPIHNPVVKLEEAYHLNPFQTNLRAIRDYLGDNFAQQLTFKTYLLIYLLLLSPIALGFQFANHYYFRINRYKQYLVNFPQLIILCFSYTIFIVIWQKKQDKFFNNFIQETNSVDIRAEHRGPYLRNIIDDNANNFQTRYNFEQNLRTNLAYLVLIVIFVLEAIYFGGIRRIIVIYYFDFPRPFIFSVSHLIFYGVYFISLGIIYKFLLKKKVIFRLVNLQNYAKVSQHQDAKRRFDQYYYFSLELIGPLFFLFLENFNGTTCYSENCLIQFQHYVISRYVIQIFKNAVYNLYKMFKIIRYRLSKQKHQKTLDLQDEDIRKTFQFKLSKLLIHIQLEYTKEEIQLNLRQQLTVFMFFSIYFMRFPFCEIVSLLVLFLDYYVKRTITIELKRRPIPDTIRSYRYTPILKKMYGISLIVNSFTFIFNGEFMEYDLQSLYTIFVTTITQSGMYTFKLFLTVFLVVCLLIITLIFWKIGSYFGQSKNIQNRKIHKFKQFLKKARRKAVQYRQTAQPRLMKTIFHTYVIETVNEYKKNKFNFLKKKLKGQSTSTPNQTLRSLKKEPPQSGLGKTKIKKDDNHSQYSSTNINAGESYVFANKKPKFQKKISKFNHQVVDINQGVTYKSVAHEGLNSETLLKNKIM